MATLSSVLGTVFEADAVTPAGGAAVNLFPDPDSRELGRGILVEQDGSFAFFGVPLGRYSIEAQSPTGLERIVAGTLDQVDEVEEITIVYWFPEIRSQFKLSEDCVIPINLTLVG